MGRLAQLLRLFPHTRRQELCLHTACWLTLAVLMFAQGWGLTAADTKHDLTVDPAGFLAGGLSAYTDTFTLGQLQNQAYGYLFPQGLFFLLTSPLPAWVAQRLWWTLVVGVGFSGMLVVLRLLGIHAAVPRLAGAVVFALSPRVLTTLTAISSETWPIMLSAWVLAAVLAYSGWRAGLAAVIPVFFMGAVNAAATLAALTPAAVAVCWRLACDAKDRRRRTEHLKTLGAWAAGTVLVSLWWAIPLVVLGRYAAPFTEFIESASVTLRWLNPAEILRGTTSWTPFVDTERTAGFLLVNQPVFVVFTLAVAALGILGLSYHPPARGAWWLMLTCGLLVMGLGFGPFGSAYRDLLDGALAAFRNVHKFDALVRIPVAVGTAWLVARLVSQASGAAAAPTEPGVPAAPPAVPQAGAARPSAPQMLPDRPRAAAALVVVGGIVAAACAPALSGRLLPRGAYPEVPAYWSQAADFVSSLDTRTLVMPPAAAARQDWGWTRDEPLQPLAEAPWATRDAIPLVNPEAIRGLDGIVTALVEDPATGTAQLDSLGVGAVLVRHDLEDRAARERAQRLANGLPGERMAFGPNDEVEVFVLDPHAGMRLTTTDPVTVAGGGEVLGLLSAALGPRSTGSTPATYQLVDHDAEIITDTPQLVARNYGAGFDATSGPLTEPEENPDVKNRLIDYPSAGAQVRVVEHGGRVRASSSAADPTSVGGARPENSATAAVDGSLQSSWRPRPGGGNGEFLELRPDHAVENPEVQVTATRDTTLVLSTLGDGEAHSPVSVSVQAGVPHTVRVPGTTPVRVELTEPAGIAEAAVEDHPIERILRVESSPSACAFFFQRLLPDSGPIRREFTLTNPLQLRLDTPGAQEVLVDGRAVEPGDTLELDPGTHRVISDAAWVLLAEPGFREQLPGSAASPLDDPRTAALGGGGSGDRPDSGGALPSVEIPDTGQDPERILLTGRAANEGLRARIGAEELEPTTLNADEQGFLVPADASGRVDFSFAGDNVFRGGLTVGAGVALVTFGGCVLALAQPGQRAKGQLLPPGDGPVARWVPAAAITAAGIAVSGAAGLCAGALAALVARWTRLPRRGFAVAALVVAAAWLARAPWPPGAGHLYAGDSALMAGAVLTSLIAAALPGPAAPRPARVPPRDEKSPHRRLNKGVAARGDRERRHEGQRKDR